MTKYKVTLTTEVNADNEEEAREKCWDKLELGKYEIEVDKL